MLIDRVGGLRDDKRAVTFDIFGVLVTLVLGGVLLALFTPVVNAVYDVYTQTYVVTKVTSVQGYETMQILQWIYQSTPVFIVFGVAAGGLLLALIKRSGM
jgi:hypothetical protein